MGERAPQWEGSPKQPSRRSARTPRLTLKAASAVDDSDDEEDYEAVERAASKRTKTNSNARVLESNDTHRQKILEDRKERNRASAAASRKKKEDQIESLRCEAEGLRQQNGKLLEQISSLPRAAEVLAEVGYISCVSSSDSSFTGVASGHIDGSRCSQLPSLERSTSVKLSSVSSLSTAIDCETLCELWHKESSLVPLPHDEVKVESFLSNSRNPEVFATQ